MRTAPSRHDPHGSVPIDSTVVFRIVLGLTLTWEAYRYLANGWVASELAAPPFHFAYPYFGWVVPFSAPVLSAGFVGLAIAAAAFTVGLWYRWSAAMLFAGWTYVFLLDRAYYLNHLYLITLLLLLMLFLPANVAWSLDTRRTPQLRSRKLPRWGLWTLRGQLAIPYFFGGVAKLSWDWLSGYPLRFSMLHMDHVRAIAPWFDGQSWAVFLAWGGLVFDLAVVPALLWKPTRPWAFTLAVAFHLANALLFPIGVFPWLMIGATTLFLEPDWPNRVFHYREAEPECETSLPAGRSRLVVPILVAWFVVQAALPLRHFLLPGNVDWTDAGAQFSWRMMLNHKTSALRLYARNIENGDVLAIDPRAVLTRRQFDKMAVSPPLIHQFARRSAEMLYAETGVRVSIHGDIHCALNGRPPSRLVDPSADLAATPPEKFVVELEEPLPGEPFMLPPSEWVHLVGNKTQ